MLVRICGSCGRKVPQGQQCECQKQRYKIYNREHRDKDRSDFYNSTQWRRTAEAVRIRAGCIDEYALHYEHRFIPGRLVHHIVPINENPALRLDLNNLVCLSPKSHDFVHAAYAEGGQHKAEIQAQLRAIRQGWGTGEYG